MLISRKLRAANRGSVLLLTLMMIVLMTFEVALVSLVVLRGLGDEGVLVSQNISARRAADSAISLLENQLYTALQSTDLATVKTQYALGGSGQASYNNQTLQMVNPATGASAASSPAIYTSAWVDTTDTRGNYFHLVGRARTGSIDLLVHRWKWIEPGCVSGLRSVLPTDVAYPGYEDSIATLPDGRIFFGAGGSNNFWTWHPSTGLTTLVGGAGSPVVGSAPFSRSLIMADPTTYRAYFAESSNTAKMYTWKEGAGLSVLIPSGNFDDTTQRNDLETSFAVGQGGRVFFAENASDAFYTYKESTGLSIIVSLATRPGTLDPGENAVAVAPDGSVYFSNDSNPGPMWLWKEGTGLSVIGNASPSTYADRTLAVGPDGRAFFGEDVASDNARQFYTWKPGQTQLSVLVDTTATLPRPGYMSTVVDSTGRVFFGGHSNVSANKPFYTWKEGSGLAVLIPASLNIGSGSTVVAENDRVFIGQTLGGGAASVWTWDSTTGLSVIASGLSSPGSYAIDTSADGRVFFGAQGSYMRTWHKDTGLSVLTTTAANWGDLSTHVTPGGRAYFSYNSTTSRMYTWKLGTGLSVLVGPGDRYGNQSGRLVDDNGTFAFGQNTAGGGNGNMYYYIPPEACNP